MLGAVRTSFTCALVTHGDADRLLRWEGCVICGMGSVSTPNSGDLC